jgi:hypothetical protein
MCIADERVEEAVIDGCEDAPNDKHILLHQLEGLVDTTTCVFRVRLQLLLARPDIIHCRGTDDSCWVDHLHPGLVRRNRYRVNFLQNVLSVLRLLLCGQLDDAVPRSSHKLLLSYVPKHTLPEQVTDQ